MDAAAAVGAVIGGLIGTAFYVFYVVQVIMAYGTAYRYTKRGGDNGVALFGWMLAFTFAALIPGLGIYLWRKSRKYDERYSYQYSGQETTQNYNQYPSQHQQTYPNQMPNLSSMCPSCNRVIDGTVFSSCPYCGHRF